MQLPMEAFDESIDYLSSSDSLHSFDSLPQINSDYDLSYQDLPSLTNEEIIDITRDNPIKRHKLLQVLNTPMPASVRKRKYHQILNSDEGENMNAEELKEAKIKIAREKILVNLTSKKKKSANVSSSQSESGFRSVVPSSLSSGDSNGSENEVQGVSLKKGQARQSPSSSSSESEGLRRRLKTRIGRKTLQLTALRSMSNSESSYSSTSGAPILRPHIPYPTMSQIVVRQLPKGTSSRRYDK